MDDKIRELANKLLCAVAEDMSNNTCNDLPRGTFKGWTSEEKNSFMKEFHKWSGDPEEYKPGRMDIMDYEAVKYIAHLIKTDA